MITQSYNLNLIPGGVPLRIPCSQRDAGSRTVVLYLFNGSEHFTVSNVSGVIQGTRADGEAFTASATVSNGTATFVISLDMTASAGAHTAELILTDTSSNVLGTANFVIDVEAEAMDDGVTPTTEEVTVYEQMRTACAALVAQAQAAATAAATSAGNASDSADDAADSASEAASIVAQAVTYTLSISGNVITLTGSDSSTSSITLPTYGGAVS